MSRTILVAGVLYAFLAAPPEVSAQRVTAKLPINWPQAVAFSPDGKQVAVGGMERNGNAPIDGLVFLLDAHTGQQQAVLRHSARLKSSMEAPRLKTGFTKSPILQTDERLRWPPTWD